MTKTRALKLTLAVVALLALIYVAASIYIANSALSAELKPLSERPVDLGLAYRRGGVLTPRLARVAAAGLVAAGGGTSRNHNSRTWDRQQPQLDLGAVGGVGAGRLLGSRL